MTEQFKSDNSAVPQHTDSEVLVLVKKMYEQLAFLEKKINVLISQSQEKPFQPASRPYRPNNYYDKRGPREDSRGRSTHSSHYVEKRPEGEHNREYSSGPDGHFKKKFGGPKKGFGPRKTPFFNKRKD